MCGISEMENSICFFLFISILLFKCFSFFLIACKVSSGAPTTYTANVLSPTALSVVERALWDQSPHERYSLLASNKYQFALPCRSSLRLSNKSNSDNNNVNKKPLEKQSSIIGGIQRV